MLPLSSSGPMPNGYGEYFGFTDLEELRARAMRIVSLFSGAGGLDLGLIRAGHNVVWANDHDDDCVASYKLNIGKHVQHGDIERVRPRDIPDADVIVGGFPCQGFSCANLRRS